MTQSFQPTAPRRVEKVTGGKLTQMAIDLFADMVKPIPVEYDAMPPCPMCNHIQEGHPESITFIEIAPRVFNVYIYHICEGCKKKFTITIEADE